LILALLSNDSLARIAREISREFNHISVESLKTKLHDITAGSMEDREATSLSETGAASSDGAPVASGVPGKTKALDQYTEDLTAKARAGKIDPILGRDFEIRQVIDILTRRRQNNPILTGEAGVGKTAVVEGFANRIAAGDVPEPLKNVAVRTLDLGLLQAGASVKGEFENRLKSVIDEVKASPQPIILFIDEAHTMIGAGGQAGQNDAANLLKPALARGELRTIAATTWAEYKKYFEKDAALARRFQVVKVDEPDEEKAIGMMRGLVEKMEEHHNVRILDEAIVKCVKLSHRYITGRQLPDKSVSVLDTACAKVALGQGATPGAIEDSTKLIHRLDTEIASLERELATVTDHDERLAELNERKAKEEEKLAKFNEQWEKEKDLIDRIRTIRAKLEMARLDPKLAEINSGNGNGSGQPAAAAAAAGASPAASAEAETAEVAAEPPTTGIATETAATPAAGAETETAVTGETNLGGEAATAAAPALETSQPQDTEFLKAELAKLNEELKQVQGETPLMQAVVNGQTVAEVISGWTGIPVGKMVADEILAVLNLASTLKKRVVGQDHALNAISERIKTSRAGLKALTSSGRSASSSPSGSGFVSGSAQSFMIVSVPTFEVSRMIVFLKSISRPSPSSSCPLSNT
jgi:type VI secretion system protein VasG